MLIATVRSPTGGEVKQVSKVMWQEAASPLVLSTFPAVKVFVSSVRSCAGQARLATADATHSSIVGMLQ